MNDRERMREEIAHEMHTAWREADSCALCYYEREQQEDYERQYAEQEWEERQYERQREAEELAREDRERARR